MPVGVIGAGEHIIVKGVVAELFRVGQHGVLAFRVCEVDGNEGLGEHRPDRFGTGVHELPDVHPDGLAAEHAVGLIAQLHHAYVHPGIPERLQALGGVGAKSGGLFLDIHTGPGLGDHLLAGVGPEVGVVEVHKKLHAVLGSPLADGNGGVKIAVAAAVAPAGAVKGVHPHPDPDVVDAVFRQNGEDILFRSVKVIELDTSRFQGGNAGSVHAQDEILGKLRNLPDIEAVRRDRFGCGSVLCAAGEKAQQHAAGKEKGAYGPLFHHNPLFFVILFVKWYAGGCGLPSPVIAIK